MRLVIPRQAEKFVCVRDGRQDPDVVQGNRRITPCNRLIRFCDIRLSAFEEGLGRPEGIGQVDDSIAFEGSEALVAILFKCDDFQRITPVWGKRCALESVETRSQRASDATI